MTFSNARSKASGLSSTPTSRAMSTKRAWRSASVSLGLGGMAVLRGMEKTNAPFRGR